MGQTNFPNGVNIAPFNIPTLMPMSSKGTAFFVDPVNGNDGMSGLDLANAVKTVPRAYQLCTAGRGDVVFLFNDGNLTGCARLTELLTWSKANTHLIGICAPAAISQRARISETSGQSATFPLLFKLDAPGCMIQNIQFFKGGSFDEDSNCIEVTTNAQRCYFGNVHIAGMGNATPALRAGSMSLKLIGAENVFDGCTIGVDTTTHGANSEVVIAGTGSSGAARNIFRNCLFPTYTSSASKLWVSAAASTFDRWILFEGCTFINAIQSGSTTMTSAMSITGTGSPAGMAIVRNSDLFGATYWTGADTAKVMLIGNPGAADSKLIGIGLVADKP